MIANPLQSSSAPSPDEVPAPAPMVLIVDDEKAQRELLTGVLSPSYRVDAAASVSEAVVKAELTPPALVIMDYAMPAASGIEGLKRLREIYPQLPVVILTGHADLEVARLAIQMGAVEYMLKPFDPADLLALVRRLTTGAAAPGEAQPAPLSEIPYALQRRLAANVDLWRSRLPTIPSENRLVAVLEPGHAVEAKILRLNRNSVMAEIYEPSAGTVPQRPVQNLQVWVGSDLAFDGPAELRSVIRTGPSSVCEFTLGSDWAEPPAGLAGRTLDAAQQFIERWRDKDRIHDAFKLAVGQVADLLGELRDWLGGIEGNWPDDSAGEGREALERVYREVAPAITRAFGAFEIEAAKAPEALIGLYAQHVRTLLHPLTLCAPFVHRAFTKPLHYPGDFEVMNFMLGDPFQGASLYARVFNAWVIRSGACATYRYRVEFLEQILHAETAAASRRTGRPCRVLSLGCGAAPEVQRFIRSNPLSEGVEFTLLDFNADTVGCARDRLAEAVAASGRNVAPQAHEFSVQQMLAHGTRLLNQPRLARSGLLERGGYDLLYCAGLFDYLSDRVCERVLRIFWELAAPGATILASNFAPTNPMRAFMDYVLDWRLLHRTEPLVRSLAVDDSLNPQSRTLPAPGGVEVFLRMEKPEFAAIKPSAPCEDEPRLLQAV
jgi:extracellular factor (EF) 3-hydroxypalmitic acid methyl ester biosynthesis protein